MIEDQRIASIYEADAINQSKYARDWGDPSKSVHLEMPEGAESDCVTVQEDSGVLSIVIDSQKSRNNKLQELRSQRDAKMKAVDIMVNDLAVGDRVDTSAVRDYRTALKDVTSEYKYVSDENKGKASLDAFADDLSDFSWPTKP